MWPSNGLLLYVSELPLQIFCRNLPSNQNWQKLAYNVGPRPYLLTRRPASNAHSMSLGSYLHSKWQNGVCPKRRKIMKKWQEPCHSLHSVGRSTSKTVKKCFRIQRLMSVITCQPFRSSFVRFPGKVCANTTCVIKRHLP